MRGSQAIRDGEVEKALAVADINSLQRASPFELQAVVRLSYTTNTMHSSQVLPKYCK